jgi:hypothetical protein
VEYVFINKLIIFLVFFSIIFFGISSILPVAMLIIGILKKDQCIIQSKIPLWLIVMGAYGLGSAVLRFISRKVCCVKNEPREEPKLLSCFTSLIFSFQFVWFIIGKFKYRIICLYNICIPFSNFKETSGSMVFTTK